MKFGIKSQLILMIITLIALTVFCASFFFLRQEKEVLIREMTRRGTTIARSLAITGTEALINEESLTLANYVDSAIKNEGVVYSMILDDKSIIMAHNQINNVGKTYVEPPGLRPLNNETVLIQPYKDKNNERIIDIALPIQLRNGARIGSVRVGMSQKAIDYLINQALKEALYIAVGLLIIGVIITIFITNIMLRSGAELMRGVKAITEGDLNFRIAIKGKNEFGILAKAFNDMSSHLKNFYEGMLKAMAKALAARDKFTGAHDQRVAEYSAACAQYIGLSKLEVDTIHLAAQVQNLGHIAAPDVVLEKMGNLTQEEYEKLKEHPLVGAEIIKQIPALSHTVPLVLHHHERFDGQGYPKGLKAKDIPLGARILSVADAYDAMVCPQRKRQPFTSEQAIQELRRGSGKQFDPEVVEAFIETLYALRKGKKIV